MNFYFTLFSFNSASLFILISPSEKVENERWARIIKFCKIHSNSARQYEAGALFEITSQLKKKKKKPNGNCSTFGWRILLMCSNIKWDRRKEEWLSKEKSCPFIAKLNFQALLNAFLCPPVEQAFLSVIMSWPFMNCASTIAFIPTCLTTPPLPSTPSCVSLLSRQSSHKWITLFLFIYSFMWRALWIHFLEIAAFCVSIINHAAINSHAASK